MSLPNSVSQPVEKQRTNIYSMLLILSFIALVTGSIVLSQEWEKFDTDTPWSTAVAAPKPPPQ